MVVDFRWRDARGKTVRSERSISPVCRSPTCGPTCAAQRRHDRDGYVARGGQPRASRRPGAFDVQFIRNGMPIGSARVVGVAPRASVDVFLPGPPCGEGEALEAVVDPRSEVDEANEENDSLSGAC